MKRVVSIYFIIAVAILLVFAAILIQNKISVQRGEILFYSLVDLQEQEAVLDDAPSVVVERTGDSNKGVAQKKAYISSKLKVDNPIIAEELQEVDFNILDYTDLEKPIITSQTDKEILKERIDNGFDFSIQHEELELEISKEEVEDSETVAPIERELEVVKEEVSASSEDDILKMFAESGLNIIDVVPSDVSTSIGINNNALEITIEGATEKAIIISTPKNYIISFSPID